MSEMKHTPGPWAHHHSPKDTTISVNTLDGNEIGGVWVKMWGDGRRGINETVLANAHLIAAAPDLLAALKEINDWIINWSPDFIMDDEWPDTDKKLRAAIAKAEGH